MHKTYLIIGSLLAGIAVILGAFGAHGLKKIVAPEAVLSFQTGVQYQMYHAFALLILGILFERFGGNILNLSGILFLVGVLLFSGSIYWATGLIAANKEVPTFVRLITPLGGLAFIGGWLLLLIGLIKK
ncbi:MAG: DUF423 domain-containing protein [Chitinophagaceae bacterium]